MCDKNCKPKWVTGKGSFIGWKLHLCNKHQIIHAMKKTYPIKQSFHQKEQEIKNVTSRITRMGKRKNQ